MYFLIKVADRIIEVHSVYKLIFYYCRDYWVYDVPPEFSVSTTEKEIELECMRVYPNASSHGEENLFYAKSEVESQIILRKISEKIIDYSTLLMHGTVVSDGKYGYMITAPSGTGKTKRARELVKILPECAIINGDKPFIKIDSRETIAYGTPWCGKEYINQNSSVPLHTIFLLERSLHTKIEKITFSEGLHFILKQIYIPKNTSMAVIIGLLMCMTENVQIVRYQSCSEKGDILDAYHLARSWK